MSTPGKYDVLRQITRQGAGADWNDSEHVGDSEWAQFAERMIQRAMLIKAEAEDIRKEEDNRN